MVYVRIDENSNEEQESKLKKTGYYLDTLTKQKERVEAELAEINRLLALFEEYKC